MNKKIIIIGASGHGKVVANIAKLNDYDEILFLDDDINKKVIGQYRIIGTSKKIDSLIKENCAFAVAVGVNSVRKRIYEILIDKNAELPTLIHPTAVIDETVEIGKGTVVMANVVINASTVIGKACIINTTSTVDHDCRIDDFVHISPGVNVAGTVDVGKRTWIGIGSSVANNLTICNDCIIGTGSTVINDLKESGTYVGNPARRVK